LSGIGNLLLVVGRPRDLRDQYQHGVGIDHRSGVPALLESTTATATATGMMRESSSARLVRS
jgi:hypothetical protein